MFETKERGPSLEDFFKYHSNIGPVKSAMTNNLYGFNVLKNKSYLESSKDNKGLVFIVRPMLNLSAMNLRSDRLMYNLLTKNNLSIPSFVRSTLDPRLAFDKLNEVNSPLVDKHNAFIPFLTNTVKTTSGWPDPIVPTFTSKEGLRKEQYIQADGLVDINNAYDLDLTFKNVSNDPGILMFQTWTTYMSRVFEGMMNPYMDMITENEIDYMTRIYRLVLDVDGKRVTKISCTGVSFPINCPIGQFFDFNSDKAFNENTKEYTIKFRSIGAFYNDPIIVKEFNECMGIFNSDYDNIDKINSNLSKIPNEFKEIFNFRSYPYINPNTYELEWYGKKESVKKFIEEMEKKLKKKENEENIKEVKNV